MTYTEKETTSKAVLIWIAIVLLVVGAFMAWKDYSSKDDRDCLEWGVVQKDSLTKNEKWAPTHSVPKSREEAERLAQELEASELTGQYHYFAKCRRWR